MVTRTALLCSPLAVALLLLAACSQSTAHPDALGDCRSAYGCNPPLGQPGAGGTSGDGGSSDGASDGSRDGSGGGADASDGGSSDARTD